MSAVASHRLLQGRLETLCFLSRIPVYFCAGISPSLHDSILSLFLLSRALHNYMLEPRLSLIPFTRRLSVHSRSLHWLFARLAKSLSATTVDDVHSLGAAAAGASISIFEFSPELKLLDRPRDDRRFSLSTNSRKEHIVSTYAVVDHAFIGSS